MGFDCNCGVQWVLILISLWLACEFQLRREDHRPVFVAFIAYATCDCSLSTKKRLPWKVSFVEESRNIENVETLSLEKDNRSSTEGDFFPHSINGEIFLRPAAPPTTERLHGM
ncbi:hypothetical protein AVEN_267680-1 [Araneus ventricosus]|uniref:Secreted protein n=1 Tax=Araneus ventricosus TaxID=182803 RepID=A0A4Y2N542_ARAVE|nr:hypothetical protein AVEN_267680-1 [Araneus ventricosus]